MAVTLWLGLWGLDRGTMWRDESATYQMARRTLPQIRDALGTVDAVHGLYYVLMHPLLALHSSEVTLRLPSVLAAVATTALVAALGCRLARPRVGLWAGLLYAATPVVTHYAQEGRSYALVAAGAAWATYLLVPAAGVGPRAGRADGSVPGSASLTSGFAVEADWADRPAPGPASVAGLAGRDAGPGPGTRVRSAVSVRGGVPRLARAASASGSRGRVTGWRWAAYGGVVAVTALLHVFAALMLAAHALTLLISRARRPVWQGWGIAAAGAVAAVVPLVVVARRQSAQLAWMRRPTPGRLWAVVEEFAGPSALVLAVNLLLITLALARPRWRSLTAVALPLICVPPVLLFALALHRPCFHERYLLFTLPGIPLLAAAGVDRLVAAVGSRLAVGVAGRQVRAVVRRRVRAAARRLVGAVVGRMAVAVAGRQVRTVVGRQIRALAVGVAGRRVQTVAARLLPAKVGRPRAASRRRVALGIDGLARAVAARLPAVGVGALPGAAAAPLARAATRRRAAARVDRFAGVDRLAGVVADRRRAVVGRRRAVVAVAAGVLAVGCAFVWQFPLHQLERQPLSRQDDLAALAAAVGRLTRPGEPVLYDPPKERRIAIAYPRPLAGPRDIALGTPGPASGTLYGVDVGPAELLRRLGGARSAWLIAADEPRVRPVKEAVLTGRFRLAYSLCLPGIRLEHYVRAGPAG
ncbi:glycosyltransferase family 39 protein [Streptomyces malaysiensis]|uniref:Glycosyltransferase family 39 protein n=1 Tax=Streptomyces malaysiensis subsp. samsunensis TaxID=459658 RepID=A0A9X2M9M1_STRMQ|nr:glycosyltransferase family 39 protein [Streptomyces samsunensis]MCQ8835579.1 glycosyltransferase family 39 protein [Streptomyces samsunensis]